MDVKSNQRISQKQSNKKKTKKKEKKKREKVTRAKNGNKSFMKNRKKGKNMFLTFFGPPVSPSYKSYTYYLMLCKDANKEIPL